MWRKMLDYPDMLIHIDFTHFLSISKRYNLPLDDLLTTDLWTINYEKYFNMHKLSYGCFAKRAIENKYTTRDYIRLQKYFKTDSLDKTQKLIIKAKTLKQTDKHTSMNVVSFIKALKNKNSDRRIKVP